MNRPVIRLALLTVLFCFCAILIALVGYWHLIPMNLKPALRALAPAVWLALAGLAGLKPASRPYRAVFMAFFGVSLGIWWASLIGDAPLRALGLNPNTSLAGLAASKLSEVLPIIAAILLVNRLEGGAPGRLLLQKGRLRLSLALGLALGAVLFALFLAMGGWEAITYVGAPRLLAATPLILVFALSNAFMEELWFRGSFLPRFEEVLGRGAALAATTVAFGVMHGAADYTSGPQLFQYVGSALVLGLGCGWIAQRTRTLWGSVLAHAIGDVCVVLGFFYALL
jgi:membrane protease YdiL (CAAX protease family)